MSSPIESSLKDKVKQIAKDQGRTFNQIWQRFVLERFLARLARSTFREQLVFKGGMLLAYYVELGRETTDLDFLFKGISKNIDAVMNEISTIKLDDGFDFELLKIDDVDHIQTPYPGYVVELLARCGDTKTKIFIDIGIGDVVLQQEFSISLSKTKKGAIFESDISILAYPPESIFAEKLETACFRGIENSRMKDFHDLWIMALSSPPLVTDYKKLKAALEKTFSNRGTKLSLIPLDSNDGYSKQEQYWQAHLRSLGDSKTKNALPGSFEELVQEMNQWLKSNLTIN